MIGETISQYRVLEKIGSGGMGTVYKAFDADLRREVALKFLDRPTGDETASQLLREARAGSALDHPNLCTVYEVGKTIDGRRFIAMAYYRGETLEKRLDRGPLPVAEALEVALGVARGLARAHQEGIVHLDVKPANVMLTAEGEVKVLDFGIAYLLSGDGHLDRVYGTVGYMAPERLKARPVSPVTDVWSLGVMLYEMVNGELPFRGETPDDLMRAINAGVPPFAHDGEDARHAEAIVARALRQGGASYPGMTEMGRDLEGLVRRAAARAEPLPSIRLSSIAVLPFADRSPEGDQAHLCQGLAEELVRLLTPLPDLEVAAPGSVLQAARDGGAEEVGRRLGVATVLEGSVQRSAERLRVTARLVRLADDQVLWSDRYDRPFADLFDIQDEIAQEIMAALELTLRGASPGARPEGDLVTHNTFLMGRYRLLTNAKIAP